MGKKGIAIFILGLGIGLVLHSLIGLKEDGISGKANSEIVNEQIDNTNNEDLPVNEPEYTVQTDENSLPANESSKDDDDVEGVSLLEEPDVTDKDNKKSEENEEVEDESTLGSGQVTEDQVTEGQIEDERTNVSKQEEEEFVSFKITRGMNSNAIVKMLSDLELVDNESFKNKIRDKKLTRKLISNNYTVNKNITEDELLELITSTK